MISAKPKTFDSNVGYIIENGFDRSKTAYMYETCAGYDVGVCLRYDVDGCLLPAVVVWCACIPRCCAAGVRTRMRACACAAAGTRPRPRARRAPVPGNCRRALRPHAVSRQARIGRWRGAWWWAPGPRGLLVTTALCVIGAAAAAVRVLPGAYP